MKIITIIVRVLLGLLFVFASASYFFELAPQPQLTGDMKTFNDGLDASGYIMPTVKAIELICGIAFIVGRFIPLATVVIFPIAVNILGVHAFLAPEGLPIATFVFAATVFLAYKHKGHYNMLLQSK
ncbi:MAG: DoxX family membrane protein [Reichenbachiella sp.]|uniref:DoxX family membrane protein n=1 Tax=Reichenbachiella sp. TaxID=2184521 RepID=UPI0032641FA5